ncbi:MAG TPA: GWxTD domain-containing protein [Candidatus Cloacimonas sp.]|jgi:GWxTD domain-containing protein|nr:GWxTD domain-containing protein [Candidatus Cloacimonas sp.]MDD3734234.1 GWxTD domain-containing protein [Candidatus Cloacimonadota bacterium]HNZ33104.1 GWxTD domain-containing protein [Candidatus Cloacimonas sp.]HOQ77507.1 GWxTD domain-containing protein [Candidatus Cloacimonas sp.]HOU26306.1 GWxTD domain-containing protein [Candidatus Cloacimonas sp.]
MEKVLSILILLFTFGFVSAQEIFYEHYANQVDIRVVLPYNNISFKKGSDQAVYQIVLEISNSRKKQVATLEKSQIIPKYEWLTDCGIPVFFQLELPQGSYNVALKIKNKAMGDKRNYTRQFIIGPSSTEIGLSWVIAKKDGIDFIPYSLSGLSVDELCLNQSYSLALDSLRIQIDNQNLTITNPQSPVIIDLLPYIQKDAPNQLALTFFENNIYYKMEPFLFSPWYAYSLRYSLNDQIRQIRYIANQNEWNVLRNVPEERQAEVIEAFWKANDPSPGTIRNELRERFYQRVLAADELFTVHKKIAGWTTDQGRIYIKYGEPDDVYSEVFSIGKYPFIIWYYYDKNLEFIFADIGGYGQYTLRNKDEEY